MTEEKQEEIKRISKKDFYFETPLFDFLSIGDIENGFLSGDVDSWSSKKETETTYSISFNWVDKISSKYQGSYQGYLYSGFAEITLTCKRKGDDILRFFVYKDDMKGVIAKVGQFPSMADLQFSDMERKYKNVLDAKYLKEFKKAVGLASHGVGVGSFVYLRRIFEKLIFEFFEKNKEALGVKKGDFVKKRMEDKIDILKDYLPTQLLVMKEIYGILSKGVHELDEEKCLNYFDPLKLSIELILDQKIEEEKKREKDKLVKKQLQEIQQNIKN